jgi:hypothetical protein
MSVLAECQFVRVALFFMFFVTKIEMSVALNDNSLIVTEGNEIAFHSNRKGRWTDGAGKEIHETSKVLLVVVFLDARGTYDHTLSAKKGRLIIF